ncbi:hypothetical protein ABZ894_08525 [Nocardia beijingensis]|uniref:hypothetical protein n=1 Tax=Nocardia beijingensis TaxID=95162 RepID=UPI003405B83D
MLLGAVLYYFGTVYSRTWYAYFGIDVGMLGFSPADITVRSMTPTFWPVVLGLLALLLLIAARNLPFVVAIKIRKPKRTLRLWYMTTLSLGVLLLAVPGLARLRPPPPWLPLVTYLPVSLVAGSLMLGYATMLYTTYPMLLRRPSARNRSRQHQSHHGTTTLIMIALLVLGFAGTIWAIGAYAALQGTNDARALARAGFPRLPSLVILSVDGLGIEGGGAQTAKLDVPGEKYHYVYSGIRLLARTPDTYFVIPQQWQARRDRIFAVPRSEDLRIDINATHND